jgi:hypothetical protein
LFIDNVVVEAKKRFEKVYLESKMFFPVHSQCILSVIFARAVGNKTKKEMKIEHFRVVFRNEDISNVSYTANSFDEFADVVRKQLVEFYPVLYWLSRVELTQSSGWLPFTPKSKFFAHFSEVV